MPIEKVAALDAVETLKANPYARWPNRDDPDSRVWPAAKPGFEPTFTFEPGEKIFTIGSCFARNIEKSLVARGFDVPADQMMRRDPDLQKVGPGALNNFSVPSIFNELSWALDPDAAFDESLNFIAAGQGRVRDLHLLTTERPVPVEEARARRAGMRTLYGQVADCRVAIITLGLAEVWFDTHSGLYLNGSPHRSVMRDDPERFELHVLSFEETMDYLRRTLQLMRRTCRPDLKVLLTVSPVPLSATFRRRDVMTANAYSKAVLRTAAETVASQFDFVTYLPVYESVTLSDRRFAWQADEVHVTADVVELNVSRILNAYAPSSGSKSAADILREIDANWRWPTDVVARLQDRPDLWATDPQLAWAFSDAAAQLGRLDLAEAVLPHLAGSDPVRLAVRTAQVQALRGDWPAVLALLNQEPVGPKLRDVYFGLRLRAFAGLDDMVSAAATALDWARSNPLSGAPQHLIATAYAARGDIESADDAFREAMQRSDEPTIAMDFADHLRRTGRVDDAAATLGRLAPNNPVEAHRLTKMREESALFPRSKGLHSARADAIASVTGR